VINRDTQSFLFLYMNRRDLIPPHTLTMVSSFRHVGGLSYWPEVCTFAVPLATTVVERWLLAFCSQGPMRPPTESLLHSKIREGHLPLLSLRLRDFPHLSSFPGRDTIVRLDLEESLLFSFGPFEQTVAPPFPLMRFDPAPRCSDNSEFLFSDHPCLLSNILFVRFAFPNQPSPLVDEAHETLPIRFRRFPYYSHGCSPLPTVARGFSLPALLPESGIIRLLVFFLTIPGLESIISRLIPKIEGGDDVI